jgi:hypothetical protein
MKKITGIKNLEKKKVYQLIYEKNPNSNWHEMIFLVKETVDKSSTREVLIFVLKEEGKIKMETNAIQENSLLDTKGVFYEKPDFIENHPELFV